MVKFYRVVWSLLDFSLATKYGVFHEKGPKIWLYKMGSCGAVFRNKINSFRKSANNPRAQKKMICFFKKLNFVPSLSFSVIWAQKLVDTFQNDYEFLDFKKGWPWGCLHFCERN